MKRCNNCFEMNSDGATNCVICGEPLDVPQTEQPEEALAEDLTGSPKEADDVGEDLAVITETLGSEGVEQAAAATGVAMEEYEAAEAPSPETEAEDWEAAEEEYEAAEEPSPETEPEDWEAAEEEYEAAEAPSPETEAEDWEAVEEEYEAAEAQPPEEKPEETPPPEDATSTVIEATDVPLPPPAAASGQVILQVFHDTEPQVVYTHPVVNDVTLIGREDPQRDVFPDVDLGTLAHMGVSATHASRQHLRLLRQGNKHYLFIYRGTTGTQINKELVDPSRYGKRFPVQVGDRIILGGKVRLKLTRQE